jgi:hypothetical protein
VPLREHELARRREGAPGAIEARSTPLPLTIALEPPATDRDGLNVHGQIVLRIGVGPSPADRQLLADELLRESPAIEIDSLQRLLAPTVRAAAAEVIGVMPAAEAIGRRGHDAVAGAVRRAADRVAYRCGLVVGAAVDLEMHCPAIIERQRHARQIEELERSREIAARFADLQAANPGMQPGELLAIVDPAHRDATLAGVLRGAATRPQRLWIASGDQLVATVIDQTGQPSIAHLIDAPELGPLRSIRPIAWHGQARLALGCRAGVMLLDPQSPGDRAVFRSVAQTDRGFNAVATDGRRVFSSHGELGLIAWSVEDARELHRWPAEAALGVLVIDDGAILLAERRRVRTLRGDELHLVVEFDADLISLVADNSTCYALLADGQAIAFGRSTPTRRRSWHATVTAGGAWASPLGFRLLRATRSTGVESFGFDDAIVHHFACPAAAMRAVSGAATTVVAVSPDRQRLVVWNAGNPAQPAGEINVTAATRHRIADMAFA